MAKSFSESSPKSEKGPSITGMTGGMDEEGGNFRGDQGVLQEEIMLFGEGKHSGGTSGGSWVFSCSMIGGFHGEGVHH
jgi:hypothetical protein